MPISPLTQYARNIHPASSDSEVARHADRKKRATGLTPEKIRSGQANTRFAQPNIIIVAASTPGRLAGIVLRLWDDERRPSGARRTYRQYDPCRPKPHVSVRRPLLDIAGRAVCRGRCSTAAGARNPNLSYAQLKSVILDNVDPLPAFQGKTISGGRLNIYRELAAVGRTSTTSASSLFATTRLSAVRELMSTTDELLA
jgi:hypothetical protein